MEGWLVITWGKYYWPYFLTLVSMLFLIPELIAVVTNHANTLSEYSWDELHVSGLAIHDIAWYLSLSTWLLFVVVITAHIWWRTFS
jgi:hypothetical protein